MNVIKKVKRTIARYGMISPGDVIMVGVSGGPDSVCLLDVLFLLREELKIQLIIAHYDHGLRKGEDELETRFVRELAGSMNLPFETERASFLIKEGHPSSLEERAREARYSFLEALRIRLQAQKIALGHNLNDQAETVLMRLLRGSGSRGLAGIPPCRDDCIIRPLIETKKSEIEAYLHSRNLHYTLDSSNLDRRYLRNRIRLDLLPQLLKYQPRLPEHLGELSHILRGEDAYMDREAQKWVDQEAETGPDGRVIIPLGRFIQCPEPIRDRVARYLIREVRKSLRRLDQRHVRAVIKLAMSQKPQATIHLPYGITVQKIYEKLVFGLGGKQKPPSFEYSIEGLGTFHLKEIHRDISLSEMRREEKTAPEPAEGTAYFDADKIEYPLVLRNFRPGDRFIPLGMRGHRKIKDFFIDLKIPSDARAQIPILISGDTPIWVCGFRIHDRFKITPNTKIILKIRIS